MTPQRWAAVGAGVLALGAVAGLVVLQSDDGEEQVATVSTSSTVEETTTTTEAATTTTSTTVAVVATTTATTAKPTTTTTTTAGPKRTWSISPTSGGPSTYVVARGTGCVGTNAGAGITMYRPNGEAFNGDGGSAMPDGTWELPFHMPANEPPGRYKIVAGCTGSNPFTYATPQYFTLTG